VIDEVRALRDELAIERRTNALRDALAKHPGAAPLADLIVGNTPADIMAMAGVLEERLSGLAPVAGEADADADATDVSGDAADGADEAPLLGGAAEFNDAVPVDEAIADAIANQDFGAFFRAAEARAVMGTDKTVG